MGLHEHLQEFNNSEDAYVCMYVHTCMPVHVYACGGVI